MVTKASFFPPKKNTGHKLIDIMNSIIGRFQCLICHENLTVLKKLPGNSEAEQSQIAF